MYNVHLGLFAPNPNFWEFLAVATLVLFLSLKSEEQRNVMLMFDTVEVCLLLVKKCPHHDIQQ